MFAKSDTIPRLQKPEVLFGADLPVQKVPAHWLMARLGKRVLRPGGFETTRWLLDRCRIGHDDDVIELAPGLGVTARAILSRRPASYAGVERDQAAATFTEGELQAAGFGAARVLRGDASDVPVPSGTASVVLGEAMLSMHPFEQKRAIIREARRLLRSNGCYAIHELAVTPDTIEPTRLAEIQRDLSRSIHVGVRIGTVEDWKGWLEAEGFAIEAVTTAPMRLLEVDRLVRDDGLAGTARFVVNTLLTAGATKRLLEVRATFRKHAEHLCAVGIVARRRVESTGDAP